MKIILKILLNKRENVIILLSLWVFTLYNTQVFAEGLLDPIFTITLPDADKKSEFVLNVSESSLKDPGVESVSSLTTFKRQVRNAGDIFYDDAEQGTLFVSSGLAHAFGVIEPKMLIGRSVVEPSPIWPSRFWPQHLTPPVPVKAQVCHPPVATATALLYKPIPSLAKAASLWYASLSGERWIVDRWLSFAISLTRSA